jgi:hypothetical protein
VLYDRKNATAEATASAQRSTSSNVVVNAHDMRVVAATPKRFINGCTQ